MVQLYISLIKAGHKSLEDVPLRWREEVRQELLKQD